MRYLPLLLVLLLQTACLATPSPVKVACVGNSVTYGWGLKDPAVSAYPTQLQQKLGNGYKVRNFGHSGATILNAGHNPYQRTQVFRDMLQFKPDIAVIELGLNDTDPRDFPNYRDAFIGDYNRLIDTIRHANQYAKIFLCNLTPIFTGHSRFLSSTFEWHRTLQQKIKEVAAINNLPVIDLFNMLHNRPDVFTDAATLHPNEAGSAIIAQTVYQYLTGNFGGLQLPPLFTENIILQRKLPIKIWGKANAGSVIKVKFMGNSKEQLVPYDGNWSIILPASEANNQPQLLEIANDGDTLRFHNVLIGDVWLCSGQSNMYFPLSQSTGGDRIADKADPLQPLRLFKYQPLAETDNRPWQPETLKKANELNFFSGSWELNSKQTASGFSAVGYVFGTTILQEEQVPVGLIEIAVGGSPLISWVSRHAIESTPLFQPAFKQWRQSDYLSAWCRERAGVNLKNTGSPFQRHPYEPSYNFEAAIAPLTSYPIKGVIWYQGESDAENTGLYEKLFPLFVNDWRHQWQQHLPFYYVQLSSINRASWNYFRDAQRRLLNELTNAGMAVSSDLGDPTDVHYKNKIPVGIRLAKLALHKTYGKNVIASGPLFNALKSKGNFVEIRFHHAAGLRTSDHKAVAGFELVLNDDTHIPAAAVIKNNKIWLQLPSNRKVKQIAYAWQPFTRANLVNKAGLPASTFLQPLN